ncbi:MAG TPA: hypothetical protein VMG62_04720, partial [Solirubrobacteraceae bacterium]|nr:hypothetical protein [Solirubrobacteraceae bacterium]
LGVWKYRQILASPDHAAHPYLDIAHRAALLYSFALLLVAVFVQLSAFSSLVNLLAAAAMALFFFASVANYSIQARLARTDNVFREPPPGTSAYMIALIVAEIGGWLVLLAGFLQGQVL